MSWMTRSTPLRRFKSSISPLKFSSTDSWACPRGTRFSARILPFSAATRYTLLVPPRPTVSILVYVLPLTLIRYCFFLLGCAAVDEPAAAVAVSAIDIFGGDGGADRSAALSAIGAKASRSERASTGCWFGAAPASPGWEAWWMPEGAGCAPGKAVAASFSLS